MKGREGRSVDSTTEPPAGAGLVAERHGGAAGPRGQSPSTTPDDLLAREARPPCARRPLRAARVSGRLRGKSWDLTATQTAAAFTISTAAASRRWRAAALEPARSRAREASSMTVAWKPRRRASSADQRTQKSK